LRFQNYSEGTGFRVQGLETSPWTAELPGDGLAEAVEFLEDERRVVFHIDVEPDIVYSVQGLGYGVFGTRDRWHS
jgi:hypothetical protein